MPRIRTIKPELFLSETLAQVSLESERTFTGLLTQADDRGRIRYSPAVLNGALWPLRPAHTVADFVSDVEELLAVNVVCRYTADDGKEYLHFPTWFEHQRISHPSTRNLCPPCPVHDADDPNDDAPADQGSSGNSPKGSGGLPEGSGGLPEGSGGLPEGSGGLPEGSGKTPQGKERKGKERTTPPINGGGSRGGDKRTPQTPHSTQSKKKTRKTSRQDANTTDTTTQPEGENDMGVYDTPVEPFTDLRQKGTIKRNNTTVGKNGLDPAYADAVEEATTHFIEQRATLGVKSRPSSKGRQTLQSLLRGANGNDAYSIEQLKDVITYTHQHHFWNGVISNPQALHKHIDRIYGSDEYVRWSLENNRPAANRPRNTPTGAAAGNKKSKKTIAADEKYSADAYADEDL